MVKPKNRDIIYVHPRLQELRHRIKKEKQMPSLVAADIWIVEKYESAEMLGGGLNLMGSRSKKKTQDLFGGGIL